MGLDMETKDEIWSPQTHRAEQGMIEAIGISDTSSATSASKLFEGLGGQGNEFGTSFPTYKDS